MKDTSTAIGRFAETGNFNFEGDCEKKLGVDLRHGDPLMKMTGIHPAVIRFTPKCRLSAA
jgi:hypothetical protein